MERFFNDDTPPIRLRWIDKDTYGICHFDKEEIHLNITLLIADTFIHELLHHRHPEWSEKRVNNRTRDIIHGLTIDEIEKVAIYVLGSGE